MDNFTGMLSAGMRERGHDVQVWCPKPTLSRLSTGRSIRKWLGYLDQYVLFPATIQRRLRKCKDDTLFVFTDQALGPWVPFVRNRRHVVHCHDFLALQSALGTIADHPTRWTGKIYQKYIKQGFSKARNFITVSKNTSQHLRDFHPEVLIRNEIVYNGLNPNFFQVDRLDARLYTYLNSNIDVMDGYIMHVGGNQWYKNRVGVIEIYSAWRLVSAMELPLLLIGEAPSAELVDLVSRSKYKADIHFCIGKNDEFLRNAYSGASLLLFPSHAEGFGWPIAEAMACGCPVITTNVAPMTEVGGNAALYIDKRPFRAVEVPYWAYNVAELIETLVNSSAETLADIVNAGKENVKRFDLDQALDTIEQIYLKVE